MRDFDREWKKMDERQDKIRRLAVFVMIFNMILILAVLGGAGYVIFLVLRYFGVV